MPTGLGARDEHEGHGAREVAKVDVGCHLHREVADRLEEEWWRRQAAGESCSRSQIIQAALEIALSDPDGLSRALARESGRHQK